jgi:hypothetical protein
MDGGPKALLEVWKASLDLFSESFGYKGRQSWSKSRFGTTLLERKSVHCHRLLVDQLFNEIEKRISFVRKAL